MDINQLRLFQKAALLEHMTRAADELKVAQPTLSKAVRRLETELGYPLFDRNGKNIRLNTNGHILLKHANAILGELRDLRIEMQEANKLCENEVVVCMQAASQLLPEIISGFTARHPWIRISITQESGEQERQWDVCIRERGRNVHVGNCMTVLKENIMAVFPPEHRLAGRSVVKLSELSRENFICLQKGWELRRITDEYCAMAGFTPNIVLESDNPATVRDMLELGIGVSLIPEITWKLRDSGRMRLVRVVEPVCRRHLAVFVQDRRYTPTAIVEFREYLADYFRLLQDSFSPCGDSEQAACAVPPSH